MSVVTLDDRDSSIVYSVGWAKAGSPNEFDSTTSWTAVAGSTAKLTFTGTSVGVFGTIAGKAVAVAPVSTYSIDGGAPTTFTATPDAKAQFRQLFYQSPDLTNTQHVLTITHPTISAPFFLDFFRVIQANSTTTINSTSASSSITSSSTSTSASASITANSTSTNSSTLSTSSSSSIFTSSSSEARTPVTVTVTSIGATPTGDADTANTTGKSASVNSTQGASKSNTGAVVGGILGGIVALVLIVFGVIVWRRRRRDKRSSMISNNFWNIHTGNSGPIVPSQPFGQESSPPPSPRVSTTPAMAQTPVSAPYPASAGYGATNAAAYQQPRYPGGYTPAPAPAPVPHQVAAYGAYPGYGNPVYAAGPDQAYAADAYHSQPYMGNAYAPPSQLMNPNYGR